MKTWLRKKIAIVPFFLSVTLLAACSGGGGGGTPPQEGTANKEAEKKEPIELVFASHIGLGQERFDKEIGNPIREKFPHITPKYIERGQGTNLPDLVAAGTVVDITWYSTTSFSNTIQALGLDYDMTELAKKYNYDMNRFYPQLLDTLKYFTDGKGIYGIPKEMSQSVMYYNKDIFDKFGVPYPKDGMTWDDAYDLAKLMTRSMDGVDYRGLSSAHTMIGLNQMSLSPFDPKQDKANVNTDGWKTIMSTMERIYKIPGNNRPTNTRSATPEIEQFEKQKNVAMTTLGWGRQINFPPDLNWDIVSLPTFKEKPKTGVQAFPIYWSVTSNSKYKDQAFEVIMYLMSDERMMEASKRGEEVPVNKPEIKKAFGTDAPALKGKNLQALFVNNVAPMEPMRAPGLNSGLRQDALNLVNESFTDMLLNNVDVNTALRTAEEKINQKFEEAKKK